MLCQLRCRSSLRGVWRLVVCHRGEQIEGHKLTMGGVTARLRVGGVDGGRSPRASAPVQPDTVVALFILTSTIQAGRLFLPTADGQQWSATGGGGIEWRRTILLFEPYRAWRPVSGHRQGIRRGYTPTAFARPAFGVRRTGSPGTRHCRSPGRDWVERTGEKEAQWHEGRLVRDLMYSRTTNPRLFAMQESRIREFFTSRGMFDPGGQETIIDKATTLGNRTHRGRDVWEWIRSKTPQDTGGGGANDDRSIRSLWKDLRILNWDGNRRKSLRSCSSRDSRSPTIGSNLSENTQIHRCNHRK